MKTRILHTKVWKDTFFTELTNSEKLLFIYYLTNERVNIIGCYELTLRETIFDTGISDETIRKAKIKFEENKKLFFKDNYVLIRNSEKYQNYTGTSNEQAKTKLFGELGDYQAWFLDTPPTVSPQYPYTLRNKKQEIRNKKPETLNKKGVSKEVEKIKTKLKNF